MEWEITTVFVLDKFRNGLFIWIALAAAASGNTGVTGPATQLVNSTQLNVAVASVMVTTSRHPKSPGQHGITNL